MTRSHGMVASCRKAARNSFCEGAEAKIAAGDDVEVDVELDTEPREVSVPADLAAALDREPSAREAFGRMPYGHQLRYVTVIEDAGDAATAHR